MRFTADTLSTIQVAERGARALIHMSDQLRDLTEQGVGPDPRDDVMHEAAEAARVSIESDFALLRNNALMGVWGALEACIDDIAINWLAETSGECAESVTSNLKVSLGDYLALRDDARWTWLLDQIKRAQSSTLKAGVSQFESILGAVGLGGEVDDNLRRAIHYAKAMRNVIAHKGGRVDARFVEMCPKLRLVAGTKLGITDRQFMAASSAMIVYVETVHERARLATGRSPNQVKIPPWVNGLESLPQAFESRERALDSPEAISAGEVSAAVSPPTELDEAT